jgi:predicted kinase
MKASAYLMCGLPGSGKTTLAEQLESENRAMRFSIDEWMLTFYGETMSRAEFDERYERCEQMIWNIAERLLLCHKAIRRFWLRIAENLAWKAFRVF